MPHPEIPTTASARATTLGTRDPAPRDRRLRRPVPAGRFLERGTGWPVSGAYAPGDPEVLVEAPAPLPGLLFIRMPEPKASKNRIHFDRMPTDRTRDEEVERVIGLGATLHEDHRTPDGRGWATLLDPEGNEFCVERGPAERGSRTAAPGQWS
ncbi:VOC family protein [Saccharopolyspora spinosporotrichia]